MCVLLVYLFVCRYLFIYFVRLNEFFRPFGGFVAVVGVFVFVVVLPSSLVFGTVQCVFDMCDERKFC